MFQFPSFFATYYHSVIDVKPIQPLALLDFPHQTWQDLSQP